jgi:hypothetical protein
VTYDLRTDLLGVIARHDDDCPARRGHGCVCGPIGYVGATWDWDEGKWVFSPQLPSVSEARAWQRAANDERPPDSGDRDGTRPSEQMMWWTVCYVGLGFVGVVVALLASNLTG